MKKSIIVALGSLLAFSPAFAQYDGAPMEKYQAKKEVKKRFVETSIPIQTMFGRTLMYCTSTVCRLLLPSWDILPGRWH